MVDLQADRGRGLRQAQQGEQSFRRGGVVQRVAEQGRQLRAVVFQRIEFMPLHNFALLSCLGFRDWWKQRENSIASVPDRTVGVKRLMLEAFIILVVLGNFSPVLELLAFDRGEFMTYKNCTCTLMEAPGSSKEDCMALFVYYIKIVP